MRPALSAAAAVFVAFGGFGRLEAQHPAVPAATTQDSMIQLIERERSGDRKLPAAERFRWGDLVVPAGSSVDGPVAAARGNVVVRGRVNGDAFAVGGDIVVHPGGEVTGSTLAVRGRVIVDGGRVGGEMKSVVPPSTPRAGALPLSGAAAVRHSLRYTAGWFVVALLVGFAVILFSGAQLEAVAQTLEQRFSTALLVGIAAQVGVVPLLVLICVALTLTVVGILLVPFAVVAYVLAVAGLVALGAMAAATVAGHALVREGANVRVRAVQSLVIGIVGMMLPWLAAALLANSAWGESLARLAAVALTWVAVSAGLGAALMARGGVRRVQVRIVGAEVSPASWQTPTPIGGIAASRRPSATPSSPTGAPQP